MGRGRRNRRDALGHHLDEEAAAELAGLAREILTPTYVTVEPRAWDAESDAPVLALDGLKPWEQIAGPAIALDGQPAVPAVVPDSSDPSQLVFESPSSRHEEPAPPHEEPAPTPEPEVLRPLLVLEPEPPVEVQAELALVAGQAAAVVAPAIEAAAEPAPEPVEEPPVDPAELLYQDARTTEEAGRLADARAAYRRVIAASPTHLGARNNLAMLLERGGDQAGALAEYDKAVDVDPEHITLLNNRGALLGAMGRYAAAERDLKKVLRSDPSHLDGLLNLGVVMTRKGLWAEAIVPLRRVIELDPLRGPAHFYLGEALNHVDDLYGAMAAYQRAAELMPSHARSLYGLGIVFDRLGRPDDAAQMYRKSREAGRR